MANGASRRREHNGVCRSKDQWSMDELDAFDPSMSVVQ
jgi:hypothetical protein